MGTGLASAHIVGPSLGGMIAQTIAIEYPDRVRSLTSMMSTTGDRAVGQPDLAAIAGLGAPPEDRQGYIGWQVRSLPVPALVIHGGSDVGIGGYGLIGSGAAHQLSERAVAAPGWPRCLEEGLWRESLPPVLDRDFWRKPRFRVCVCAKIGYSSERTLERSGGHVRTWLSW
jgi:pimeloyl-ACP methyl ester carboxylesterase